MNFLPTFFIFLTLSLLNLVFLWGFFKNMLGWARTPLFPQRQKYILRMACWGSFKLVFIGLFIILLLKVQKFDIRGILLGMSALILVPMVGGFVWSFRKKNEI